MQPVESKAGIGAGKLPGGESGTAPHAPPDAGSSAFQRHPWDWVDVSGRLMRRATRQIARVPSRIRERLAEERVISIRAPEPRGQALISYVLTPFMLPPGQPIPNHHTQFWEARAIADAFLAEGYSIDVISFMNEAFMPRKQYDFAVDVRWNLERLVPVLGPRCTKIMHIDIAHVLFHNEAEARRLLDLQRRRGVTLTPRRHERSNFCIEAADCATMLGNDFTLGTYRYSRKPIFKVPITAPELWPSLGQRDFEQCRTTFLWLGTYGLVHKGLDLVLEAFAEMPQYRLIVCGPINEEDFVQEYRRELYETPNIETIGWIDIGSRRFREIAEKCVALVFPSCSEGQSGSTVTAMHAGLIPIVSYESGVDVAPEFGIILKTCAIEEIKSAVSHIAGLPPDELRSMSERARSYAQTHHTRENFTRVYREIVRNLAARRAA
jgi:glycosyltransferase involved in cell wall biosynthesis